METSLWTLDELGARVALALAVGYDGQANDRVHELPDRRTIRYYTTLGLIDRPAIRALLAEAQPDEAAVNELWSRTETGLKNLQAFVGGPAPANREGFWK